MTELYVLVGFLVGWWWGRFVARRTAAKQAALGEQDRRSGDGVTISMEFGRLVHKVHRLADEQTQAEIREDA